ncbi:MAG TPA: glycosyltransferase [Solirubrobacteraceae bacterium]|jgi:hypothetical protein|nr:glycosyltransferase [Solirubrobacteraceae bacterium]
MPPLDQAHARISLVRWPAVYQHPNAEPFVRAIKGGLATCARMVVTDIPQPYEGIVLFEVDHGGGLRRVAIDYFDFTFVNEPCANEVDMYFKFQYLRGGYPGFTNVVPGGYVTSSSFPYTHWCKLRALRRSSSATVDVFGRFGLRYSASLRRAAIGMLESDGRLSYAGGTRPTQYTRYLREMARARVCVDLPGQGPFCYRLIECLAMGCCVIGPRHTTELPDDLRDGIEIVHCSDDLDDLADLCVTYAGDATIRAPIEVAAAEYFDEHLHPVRIAERYLNTVAAIAETRR